MRKREGGSITIFLSLTLMILISFVCTALRSAQAAGSGYLFTVAAEAAARSVFGVYDTRVWEQYRVLMLSDRQLADTIGQECISTYEKSGTLFALEDLTMDLVEGVTVAENGAVGWEKAMVSYMESCLPVEVVSQWITQSDLLEGLENMTQWIGNFRDLLKPLIRLEQKLCGLEERLEEAVELYHRGKGLLKEFQSCCEKIQQLLSQAGDSPWNPVAFEETWSSLKNSYETIQEYLRESDRNLDTLGREAEEDLDSIEHLRTQVTQLMSSLMGDDSGLGALADLGGYLSGLTKRFEYLQELPGELDALREYLCRVDEVRLPTAEEVLAQGGQELVDFLQGLMEGFAAEVWDPNVLETDEGTEEDQQRVGILMQLRSWLDQGILGLVIQDPDQVSQAILGRRLDRSERQEDLALWESVYRRVLRTEYTLRYTADGAEEALTQRGKEKAERTSAGAGLQYETEYVIAGHDQDSANLAAVASRLLLMRGALNLIYLLQNSSDQESLSLVAAGLSAALGGWIPQGLMVVLLMVVWAMAEAVCDVRALLAGGNVPFWKDAASWKLAWEHLWTLLEDGFVTGLDRPNGMSYSEYLRFLLYLVPETEMCFRIMEVAEENLRAERASFCIDQGWYQAVVVLEGKAAGDQRQRRVEYCY